MNYISLTEEIAEWTKQYFKSQPHQQYCFHNLAHTEDVVQAVKQIADHYHLNSQDQFIVTAAAYFHDLGYFSGGRQSHESRSAALAEEFLKDRNVDPLVIDSVKNCILATQIPQHPKNLLEAIICDADLFHLGAEQFVERNKLMRIEWMACTGTEISKKKWNASTLELMSFHHFHTEYAQKLLTENKQKNLAVIKESVEVEKPKKKDDAETNEIKRKKDNRPDRGIETMFRVTSTNNQRLSDMADNKSNILITVNSIILSVVISLLLRKLDNNEHLTVPTLLLLMVSLLTMIFAILATRPKLMEGVFSDKDVDDKKVNLLFFGNFYKMDLADYNTGMQKVMEDRDFLYGMLIKDVYSQGVVLGRKYKLLRLAYNTFMYGLILSVLSYLVVILI